MKQGNLDEGPVVHLTAHSPLGPLLAPGNMVVGNSGNYPVFALRLGCCLVSSFVVRYPRRYSLGSETVVSYVRH